jgi:hypothetical protein
MKTVRTDSWPQLPHVCVDGVNTALRFKGPARDGARETCVPCATEFLYVKPKPAARSMHLPAADGEAFIDHFK